jgi:formylmethanofuran dehydrogenase subunit E
MKHVISGERECDGCGDKFVMQEGQKLCKACQKERPHERKKQYTYQDISKTELDAKVKELADGQKLLIDKVNKLLVLSGSNDIEDKPKGFEKQCEKCGEVFYAKAPATKYCNSCKGK